MSALSLSTTMMGSPASILSPTFFSQDTTRPLVIVELRAGIMISVVDERRTVAPVTRGQRSPLGARSAAAPATSSSSMARFDALRIRYCDFKAISERDSVDLTRAGREAHLEAQPSELATVLPRRRPQWAGGASFRPDPG